MSSTDQQAAATQQTNEVTDEEKKRRAIELQQQIDQARAKAGAPNPAGKGYDENELRTTLKDTPVGRAYQSWIEEKKIGEAQLPEYTKQYDELVGSASPEVRTYAESHPATQYEIQRSMEGKFAANLNTKQRRGDLDYQRREIYQQVLKDNPGADIDVIDQLYKERVDVFNKNISNVSTNYEATLAARQQGFNVGSGISDNLSETFQKDFDKRFAEHNKGINLTEGTNPLVSKPAPAPEAPKVTPQNPRVQIERNNPNKLYGNPKQAIKNTPNKNINLSENILTSSNKPVSVSQPQNNLASIFGIAPEKPRELTKEQVMSMTPEQISAYNQQVQAWNQYAAYTNDQAKDISKANMISNRENWERNRARFAKFVAEAKKDGVQFVNLETPKGIITVPIEQALQKKGVTGISAVPQIPEGYTVGGRLENYPENLVLMPEDKRVYGPIKPQQNDYVKNFASLFGTEQPVTTATQNAKSPVQNIRDVGEGVGTGLLRTSLLLTNTVPEAFMNIIAKRDAMAGSETLQKQEEQYKALGIGPSVLPSIETGQGTGRSTYYNAGELAGEIIPALLGIEKAFKNPFAKGEKIGVRPKTNAPEIATSSEKITGVKAYPARLTRDQGYGEKPDLIAGYNPKEETNIKKAFQIPEPFVQEQGLVRGAKDYGNLREQIAGIKEPESVKGVTPVELDALYKPDVEVRRAPEPNTFRVDEGSMFGKDTASTFGNTNIDLGTGTGAKIEPSKNALAGVITKPVNSIPFGSQAVRLGEGRIIETRLNLGESPLGRVVKTRTPVNQFDVRLTEKPEPEVFKIEGKKPVAEDVFYTAQENIPRTRAKKIGTYRIQTDKLIGRTVNPLGEIFKNAKEPLIKSGSTKIGIRETLLKLDTEKKYPRLFEKKAFERSAVDAEKRREANKNKFISTTADLGKGIIQRLPARPGGIFSSLGRGKGYFVSRSTGESGLRKFNAPRPPPSEGELKNNGKQIVIQKSESAKFSTQKVELGIGKGKAVMIAGGGAASLAPLPLVHPEEGGGIFGNNTISNGTGTNSTGANSTTIPPLLDQGRDQQSVLEPQSITDQRPSTTSKNAVAAISGTSQRSSLNQLTGIRVSEKTKQGQIESSAQKFKQPQVFKQKQTPAQMFRQKLIQPYPEAFDFAQPQRFAQALRQPEALKLKTKQPQQLKFKEPPRGAGAKLAGDRNKKKESKRQAKKPDFLGNVPEEQISGMFNRYEVIVGTKRSAKQLRKDNAFTRKKNNVKSFVHGSNKQFLSNKKTPILDRPKKKVKNPF